MRKLSVLFAALYFLFFASFYHIFNPLKQYITSLGKGVQIIFIVFAMLLINKTIKHLFEEIKFNDKFGISQMMQIFAFCCMLLTFLLINDFPEKLWSLGH